MPENGHRMKTNRKKHCPKLDRVSLRERWIVTTQPRRASQEHRTFSKSGFLLLDVTDSDVSWIDASSAAQGSRQWRNSSRTKTGLDSCDRCARAVQSSALRGESRVRPMFYVRAKSQLRRIQSLHPPRLAVQGQRTSGGRGLRLWSSPRLQRCGRIKGDPPSEESQSGSPPTRGSN